MYHDHSQINKLHTMTRNLGTVHIYQYKFLAFCEPPTPSELCEIFFGCPPSRDRKISHLIHWNIQWKYRIHSQNFPNSNTDPLCYHGDIISRTLHPLSLISLYVNSPLVVIDQIYCTSHLDIQVLWLDIILSIDI